MAKKKWIKTAVSEGKGTFKAKAKTAGESTKEYAKEKANAPGKLGKEARLANTLMDMKHKKSGLSPKKMYKGK